MPKGKPKKTEIITHNGEKWLARKKPGRPRENGMNYDLIEKVEDDTKLPEQPKKKDDGIFRFSYGHLYRESGRVVLKHCPKCDKRNHAERAVVGQCMWCDFSAKGMSEEELKTL